MISDRYVICNNCDIKIDCDNKQIFCLYLGEQSNPDNELIICEYCNFDLKNEFKKEGYNCDDWDLEDNINLCRNQDCLRYPDDELFDENNENEYESSEWIKCSLCDGYFIDDGLNDILFIEEEPNNYNHSCDLCGKTKNIVQMKATMQYICQNACDESDDDSDDSDNNT